MTKGISFVVRILSGDSLRTFIAYCVMFYLNYPESLDNIVEIEKSNPI